MTATVCSPWCTDDALALGSSEVAIEPAVSEKARILASDVLYNLTRRRWPGECLDEYHPMCGLGFCSTQAVGVGVLVPYSVADFLWWPEPSALADPRWTWLALPAWNATKIEAVDVNGEDVPVDGFELRDGHWLVRVDGQGWPCDDVGTDVRVLYRYGTLPPPGGVAAAAALATQIAIAWTPASKMECRLPTNVTTVVRQGVTYTFDVARRLVDAGQVGLTDVDLWVSSVNRGDASQRARIGIPGVPANVSRIT